MTFLLTLVPNTSSSSTLHWVIGPTCFGVIDQSVFFFTRPRCLCSLDLYINAPCHEFFVHIPSTFTCTPLLFYFDRIFALRSLFLHYGSYTTAYNLSLYVHNITTEPADWYRATVLNLCFEDIWLEFRSCYLPSWRSSLVFFLSLFKRIPGIVPSKWSIQSSSKPVTIGHEWLSSHLSLDAE